MAKRVPDGTYDNVLLCQFDFYLWQIRNHPDSLILKTGANYICTARTPGGNITSTTTIKPGSTTTTTTTNPDEPTTTNNPGKGTTAPGAGPNPTSHMSTMPM